MTCLYRDAPPISTCSQFSHLAIKLVEKKEATVYKEHTDVRLWELTNVSSTRKALPEKRT
jgi:hypothetical protein